MKRRRALWLAAGLGVAAVVAAALIWVLLNRASTPIVTPAPPHAAPTPLPPPAPSSIALSVRLPMAVLQKAVEAAVPTTLWAIDEPDRVCVPAASVKLFAARVKVTPDIRCRLVGTAIRGPIRLTGTGGQLRLIMPISAEIRARDIGGIIASETVTATALVTADLRPTLTDDGRLTMRIGVAYDWQQEPGVTIMGQRIRLTDKADAKLAPVLAKVEIDLERRLVAVPVRERLEALWRSGFSVSSLNKRNPPTWLRLTPLGLGLGGIAVEGKELRIDAVLTALAQVHVGAVPARPQPTPLPRIATAGSARGVTLNVAVLSDYATLEKVVAKALAKMATRGIEVAEYGRVKVRFRRTILYGTNDGRLALGLDLSARGPQQLLNTRGLVWLTARAETVPGSQQVLIRDVQLFIGAARDQQLPLLVAVAQTEIVRDTLEAALAQDFTRDYAKLMAKIDKALLAVPIGDFRLSAQLTDIRHGRVLVLGQGLYLPVTASGSGRMDYAKAEIRRARDEAACAAGGDLNAGQHWRAGLGRRVAEPTKCAAAAGVAAAGRRPG